ncbi:MAG: Multidrug transporter EmrE [bacterium]|nr:Multidrug transporter EmrE [bacterium]
MTPYLLLGLAILFEIAGTTSMKLSVGFTKLVPSLGVVVGYGCAFALMAQTLKVLPLGVVYAIWSGVGTAGTALIGLWLFREALGAPQLAGIGLIIAGVVLLQWSTPPATG